LGKFKDADGTVIKNPKPKTSWTIFIVVVIIGLANNNGEGSDIKQFYRDGVALTMSMRTDDANIVNSMGSVKCKWRTENSKIVFYQPDGTILYVLIPINGNRMKDAVSGEIYDPAK
jgi:hypothetical protein